MTKYNILDAFPHLRVGNDGILYAQEVASISYPENGHETCFEVEDRSFWFQHRNNCIREIIAQYPPSGQGPIFDVGGGNGFVAKGLMDSGHEVVLIEPGPRGAMNAKRRGVKNVICGSTQSSGLKSKSISAIGIFDVAGHIPDDSKFFEHLRDLLQPNGVLYFTDAAYGFLWSQDDDDMGHLRRYSLSSAKKNIEEAGFEIAFASYFFALLPIPMFLLRTLPYRLGMTKQNRFGKAYSKQHSKLNRILAAALNASFRYEINKFKNKKNLPFGGSCIIVGVKK